MHGEGNEGNGGSAVADLISRWNRATFQRMSKPATEHLCEVGISFSHLSSTVGPAATRLSGRTLGRNHSEWKSRAKATGESFANVTYIKENDGSMLKGARPISHGGGDAAAFSRANSRRVESIGLPRPFEIGREPLRSSTGDCSLIDRQGTMVWSFGREVRPRDATW